MVVRALCLSILLVACAATPHPGANAAGFLPGDPMATCTVPPATFQSWFKSGIATENGFVNPADSVAFPINNTVCDFYLWSEQMFLWLTSEAPASYGGSGSVFASPVFFNVSPESGGKRTLIPNTDLVLPFPVRIQKPEQIGETGQAGGSGVLISQAGSLVYYGIHVNDVYAYFLTGQKAGKIAASDFPNTQADLNAVTAYVSSIGVSPLQDANALTLELKTSWVDASTVADKSQFVTISATVPSYTKTSSTQWTPTGNLVPMELALVGMHVVGTVQSHPEMVWATFEHVTNTANNAYVYTDTGGTKRHVPFDSSGNWIFMPSGGPAPDDSTAPIAVDKNGNIVATPPHTIGPVAAFHENPWGSANSVDSSAVNDTEIISINDNVIGQLQGNDVRKNYVMIGAIWTQKGNIPNNPNTLKGSTELANSTMETYHQNLHCFTCHSISSGSSDGLDISHIYSDIAPLAP